MNAKSKSKPNLHCLNNQHVLSFVILLFVVSLVFSCFTSSVFINVSHFVSGTSDNIVSNETELRNAISDTPLGKAVVIALGNDIILTGSTLTIPTGKDITLTSNKADGYYTLIGTVHEPSPVMVGECSVSTITVNGKGLLKLDGINITHNCSYGGYLVTVSENGQFIMQNGLISSDIGGVSNSGTFLMSGGEISNNVYMNGGGVFNRGVFRMSGGVISGNSAGNNGGGVYNEAGGIFEMLGGTISGNVAGEGGGVYNWGGAVTVEYSFSGNSKEVAGFNQCEGSFTLSGGVISGNTAWKGGGVGNHGVFTMNGGVISDNTATGSGGGVNNGQTITRGNFEMSGGEISGNSAEKGGGVYNFFDSKVSLSGKGVISNNKAANLGGGICNDGDFTMSKGSISGNSASSGGGVYIGNGNVRLQGGKVFDNTATQGDNVYTDNGNLTLSENVITDDTTLKDAVVNSVIYVTVVVVVVCVVVSLLYLVFQKKKTTKEVAEIGKTSEVVL